MCALHFVISGTADYAAAKKGSGRNTAIQVEGAKICRLNA